MRMRKRTEKKVPMRETMIFAGSLWGLWRSPGGCLPLEARRHNGRTIIAENKIVLQCVTREHAIVSMHIAYDARVHITQSKDNSGTIDTAGGVRTRPSISNYVDTILPLVWTQLRD